MKVRPTTPPSILTRALTFDYHIQSDFQSSAIYGRGHGQAKYQGQGSTGSKKEQSGNQRQADTTDRITFPANASVNGIYILLLQTIFEVQVKQSVSLSVFTLTFAISDP